MKMKISNWFKELLMKLRIIDRPVASRSRKDRRKDERRWQGPDGAKPRPSRDPRRKRERRQKGRRG
ncbi:MAG TPA: hypothetical protein VK859_04160 [bacterium]|nr:hypothetical protein [bacterium]